MDTSNYIAVLCPESNCQNAACQLQDDRFLFFIGAGFNPARKWLRRLLRAGIKKLSNNRGSSS